MSIRYDWTLQELQILHERPLLSLIQMAMDSHKKFHKMGEIQLCQLISVKTGGCPEDCKYCAQSSRYSTNIKAQPMMKYEQVIADAKTAISKGATRVCLGAAIRGVRNNKQFEEILKLVKEISTLGVEVCCTLGLLNEKQAERLKEAGLYAYNHNLDSSERLYKTFVTTRSYQDRLQTLDTVEKVGITTCCGGIIGMGETIEDRLELLLTLSRRKPHPESVPINKLVPIPGTPLGDTPSISHWEIVRLIAIARIIMPRSMIRLSAGRLDFSIEEQSLCFLAGANSIFMGEKLLTVQNNSIDADEEMFKILGLKKRAAYANNT